MSKYLMLIIPFILLCMPAYGAEKKATEQQVRPHFTGTEIPVPPEQNKVWAPPRQTNLYSAIQFLFKQGMADPRGCEYREVKLALGGYWARSSGIISTHGWVLPAKERAKQRFAVCWNGLVYPVMLVGKKADYKADVHAMLNADEKYRAKYAQENPDDRFNRDPNKGWPEDEMVSYKKLLPIKTCLLLRLGEEELAKRMWKAWAIGIHKDTNNYNVHLKDPYLMLARDWVWSLYSNAVLAHHRKDDNLALIRTKLLAKIKKPIEEEAKRRGFNPLGFQGKKYLYFVCSPGELAVDMERRRKEPKRKLVIEVGLDKYPDKDKRIAALIEDLEEILIGPTGGVGGGSFRYDPIVMALVDEGDSAVEPLIRCLEKDNRFTRAFYYPRRYQGRYYYVHQVYKAAHEALTMILQTATFESTVSLDNMKRHEKAAVIRKYWQKYKGVPIAERWYRILADDKVEPYEWIQAAGEITSYKGGTYWSAHLRRKQGKLEYQGETLRKKKNPSVSELLIKRINELVKQHDRAYPLVKALAKWDGKAHLDTLRWFSKLMEKRFDDKKAYSSWVEPVIYLYEKRIALGDKGVVEEYASWVVSVVPDQFGDLRCGWLFSLMRKNPDNPAIKKAAQWLFNNEKSPWISFIKKRGGRYALGNLLTTPLIGMEEFRRLVLRGLADKTKVGTVKLLRNREVKVEYSRLSSSSTFVNEMEKLDLAEGEKQDFRVCDVYATVLSHNPGTPKCELYWKQIDRDKAIATCIDFLQRYGKRFKYRADLREKWDSKIIMPPLNRPATPEDVKNGSAIFSLAGKGKTRVVKMSKIPLRAEWVTLKKYPYMLRGPFLRFDGTTQKHDEITYMNAGIVVQAEEVFVDGKWKRYYGFVGTYDIAKVPAEEIEFTRSRGIGSTALSRKLSCRVSINEQSNHWYRAGSFELGKPLSVSVWLFNHKGISQRIPSVFYRDNPKTGPAFHYGIDMKLSYRPAKEKDLYEDYTARYLFPEKEKMVELKSKVIARFKALGTGKIIGAAEEVKAFQLDITKCFDIKRPGYYKLQFIFSKKDAGFTDGRSSTIKFYLAKPNVEEKKR